MRAMLLREPSRMADGASPLYPDDVAVPDPGHGDLLVRVSVCGVCRTDLDVVEGRLTAPRYPVIPGHQVIGSVERVDDEVGEFRVGDRVGVAWIHSACGRCPWCRSGRENLCPYFRSTGCDENGGYAEYIVVPAAFAHVIPPQLPDASAAPLLCAGAIGLRSLRLTGLVDGQPLGLTGFGASAHLVLQLARHRFPASPVYVFARNAREREFARELGAEWAGDTADQPPERMAAIIDTTPAWKPVLSAMERLVPGGRLVINAIRKSHADQGELGSLDYAKHLWMEREIKSVANVTRADVREMLVAAEEMNLHPSVEELPLSAANMALARVSRGEGVRGALVLRVGTDL
jgi:propanol-preferring alcohol dehydrogenase